MAPQPSFPAARSPLRGSLICGIFIGGPGRRMGGLPKGLLPSPEPGQRTLVGRLSDLVARHGLPVYLVGEHADYADLGLPFLTDNPVGVGPIGGLAALLGRAAEVGSTGALALACDLPYLDDTLLLRLLHVDGDTFDAFVPRRSSADPFEPLCARYALSARPAIAAALANDQRSLQRLLSRLRVQTLPISDEEAQQVRDWDRPEDLPPSLRPRTEKRAD